jgi:hypothetical protein
VATATGYVTPAMLGVVGRELGRQASFPIAESDIRRWAVAVYYPAEPPRLYWDAAYAARTSFGGIVAPEEFNPFAWMVADPPGLAHAPVWDPNSLEKGLGVDPPPTTHQLNGGIDVTYGARMRPGDVITSVTSLYGYHERTGRLGRMLFTTLESIWTNQRGEQVRSNRGTVIRY